MALKTNRFILIYHYIAEMLILFLLLYPYFYYSQQAIPFMSYLVVLVISLLIFLLLAKFTQAYAIFMAVAPILFGLNYALGFTLFASVVIALVFTWRFIVLNHEMYLGHERLLLQITIGLSLLGVIIFQDIRFIWILISQLVILGFGYLLANQLAGNSSERRFAYSFIVKIIVISVGLFIIFFTLGQYVLRFIWDTVFLSLWQILTQIIIAVFVSIMYLLEKIPLPSRPNFDNDDMNMIDNSEMNNEQAFDFEQASYNPNVIYTIAIVLIAAVLIYIFIKFSKRKFQANKEKQVSAVEIESFTYEKQAKASLSERFKKRFFKRPKHPIRQTVYDFEKQTDKLNMGRKPSETIQEWFERIEAGINPTVYEQVRYGDQTIASHYKADLDKEIKQFLKVRKEGMHGKNKLSQKETE